MRLTAKAFVLSFFMIVACQQAIAVAYGQDPPPRPPIAQASPHSGNSTTLWGAIKEATFTDRCASYLDRTALFVKDILDQFGLYTEDKK